MPAPDDFVDRLARETEAWRDEGLITEDQARRILLRYGRTAAQDARGRLAALVTFLGAVLLGIGVIVFFAANWPYIPGSVKLGLILAGVLAANLAGYPLRYATEAYRGTGRALIFLGALLYGAALFLIAQGFHVNTREPLLLVLWAGGVLPMAYILGSRAMAALATTVLAIALGWEASFWLENYPGLHVMLVLYLIFGCLLYAVGLLHGVPESTRPFREVYASLGLVVVLSSLFPLTFAHRDLHYGMQEGLPTGFVVRFWILTVVALAAAVAALLRPDGERPTQAAESAALIALLALAVLLYSLSSPGVQASVVANVLLLGLTLGAIAAGMANGQPTWVNLGVLFFGVHVFARYFDWFWELLPRSGFFAGAGLLLLLGGMGLERTRQRALEALREAEVSP